MTHRKAIFMVVCLFCLLALSAFALIPDVVASGLGAPEFQQPGRDLTVSDWTAHLSLLLAVSALVIIVDGFIISLIIRNRRKNRDTV